MGPPNHITLKQQHEPPLSFFPTSLKFNTSTQVLNFFFLSIFLLPHACSSLTHKLIMATATTNKWLTNFINTNGCNILVPHVSKRQRQQHYHQQSMYLIHRQYVCYANYFHFMFRFCFVIH